MSRSPYELARLAGVADPDGRYSPGAEWLRTVAEAATECEDISECADSLVPVYSHERMQVLVDLAAYREDVHEYATTTDDMLATAALALYMVAERLLTALTEEDAA